MALSLLLKILLLTFLHFENRTIIANCENLIIHWQTLILKNCEILMPLKFIIIDIHESFYATKSSCFTGCANIFALIRPRGLGQEKNICALDG